MTDPFLFGAAQGSEANQTVMSTSIAILLCPADARFRFSEFGVCNYRGNIGVVHYSSEPTGAIGLFGGTAAAVVDGLAQSAAFSEKLVGRFPSDVPRPRSDMISGHVLLAPHTVEESRASCAGRIGQSGGVHTHAGLSWLVGSPAHTLYNHIIEPNSTIVDCILRTNPVLGLFGSRSNHPGGVNLALGDGSVRWVASSIDRQIWRALGTRSGGEVVSGNFP